MPLRDHFRPPASKAASWEAVHGGWPMEIVRSLGRKLPRRYVAHPRVHLEEPHLHCEGGSDPAELDRLTQWGYELVRWRRRNLYFGGAAAVELREDGSLDAAGDPRRGGHGVIV